MYTHTRGRVAHHRLDAGPHLRTDFPYTGKDSATNSINGKHYTVHSTAYASVIPPCLVDTCHRLATPVWHWHRDLAGEVEEGGDVSVSVQQAAGAAYRDAAAWGPAPSMRLYLVGSDPRRPGTLRQALAARGAYTVSYIPDDTWLVAATPQAMREVALELGVRAVGGWRPWPMGGAWTGDVCSPQSDSSELVDL